MRETEKILSQYDHTIFGVSCPSYDKEAKRTESRDWQNVQKYLERQDIPRVATFHDRDWKRKYPWVNEVHYNAATEPHDAKFNYFNGLNYPIYTIHFPVDATEFGEFRDQKSILLSSSQWLKWKHIESVLDLVPHLDVNTVFTSSVKGMGIEHSYLKYNDIFKKAFDYEDSKGILAGKVEKSQVKQYLKQAFGLFDFSF